VTPEQLTGKLILPSMSVQRVAPREAVALPFEWRQTLRSRVLVCAVVFALWTVGIEARLIYLQVVEHAEMTLRANKQQIRTLKLPGKRGEILDRNGKLLAMSVDAETIAADPSHVVDSGKTASQICAALDACDGAKLVEIKAKMTDLVQPNDTIVVPQRFF